MKKLSGIVLAAAFVGGLSLAPLASAKEEEEGAKKKKAPNPEAMFKKMDKDDDGKVTEVEYIGKREGEKATKAKEIFAKKDKDSNGSLTLEEMKKKRGKKGKAE